MISLLICWLLTIFSRNKLNTTANTDAVPPTAESPDCERSARFVAHVWRVSTRRQVSARNFATPRHVEARDLQHGSHQSRRLSSRFASTCVAVCLPVCGSHRAQSVCKRTLVRRMWKRKISRTIVGFVCKSCKRNNYISEPLSGSEPTAR